MLSREAVEKILGLEKRTPLDPQEMAQDLVVTFYPYDEQQVSKTVADFSKQLHSALEECGVRIVPYEDSFETIPYTKIFIRIMRILFNDLLFLLEWLMPGKEQTRTYIELSVIKNALQRKRIKKGISVIATGSNPSGSLPMDRTSSFRRSSVVTILNRPEHIKNDSSFHEHFDAALDLFAYHMTNVVIAVDENEWILYNFNASHPIYPIKKDFKKNILQAFLPKIAAPLQPLRFSDFTVENEHFDANDEFHRWYVDDFIRAGVLFEEVGLYPHGKKIDELPFRSNFYRWIGKIHLDQRSGMSYGFLAWQLPVELPQLISQEEAVKRWGERIQEEKDYFFDDDGGIVVRTYIPEHGRFYIQIPEVWVLSQRSGSDKTHLKPERDLVKIGLKNGKMYLRSPRGLTLTPDYKPSFDTKVMLAHAVGNAIIATIISYFYPDADFVERAKRRGFAMVHWHGYINPHRIPEGWYVHGVYNPHVACSTPQSAAYALSGKLDVFQGLLSKDLLMYQGDVHLEPHHGTNVCFTTLTDLAEYVAQTPPIASLGNEFLKHYQGSY